MTEEYHLELKRMRADLKACEQEERTIEHNCKHSSQQAERALAKAQRDVGKRLKELERQRLICVRGVQRRREGIEKRVATLQGRIAS